MDLPAANPHQFQKKLTNRSGMWRPQNGMLIPFLWKSGNVLKGQGHVDPPKVHYSSPYDGFPISTNLAPALGCCPFGGEFRDSSQKREGAFGRQSPSPCR